MGAAWPNPPDKNLDRVIEMISVVNKLSMESCVTLGMLNQAQTQKLPDSITITIIWIPPPNTTEVLSRQSLLFDYLLSETT